MTLSAGKLGARLKDALLAAGTQVEFETELHERPILLTAAGRPWRIFLWNATPGGPAGVRAETEFRVQTRRPGTVPFLVEDGRRTVLLGYHESLDVFSGWDVRAHPNPGTSSSLQIPLETLEEAADAGFASNRRQLSGGDEEVVFAFAPGGVGTYLEIMPAYETAVADASHAALGEVIASGQAPPDDELPTDEPRRIAVRTVVTLVRDRRFRTRVIKAYRGKCAFCGLGLGLIDAAHIRAVQDDGPDVETNGICACPTHHRALDRGLITLGDNLEIELNWALLLEAGFPRTDIDELAQGLFAALAVPEANPPDPGFIQHHRAKWLGGD